VLAQRDETKEEAVTNKTSIQSAQSRLCSSSYDRRMTCAGHRARLRRFSLRKLSPLRRFCALEVDLPESIQPPESKVWEATFRNLREFGC